MLESAIWLLIWVCVIWAIVGLLIWLLREAFFLPEPIKPWGRFFLLAVGIVATCFALLSWARGDLPTLRTLGSVAPATIESVG